MSTWENIFLSAYWKGPVCHNKHRLLFKWVPRIAKLSISNQLYHFACLKSSIFKTLHFASVLVNLKQTAHMCPHKSHFLGMPGWARPSSNINKFPQSSPRSFNQAIKIHLLLLASNTHTTYWLYHIMCVYMFVHVGKGVDERMETSNLPG